MGPSMMRIAGRLGELPPLLAALASIHGTLGGFAEGLGTVLVFKKFGNMRNWMRVAFLLWMSSLLLGISVYLLFYVI